MKIIQEPGNGSPDTKFAIEYDEYERNEYVRRFLETFNADLTDDEMCKQVYAIHCEVRHRHELYIAVADRLEPKHRRALHIYAQCRGDLSNVVKFPAVQE